MKPSQPPSLILNAFGGPLPPTIAIGNYVDVICESSFRENCAPDNGSDITKVPREAEVLWYINTVLLVLLGECCLHLGRIPN